MGIENRKPNWNVWQNVPDCEVWKAVALSLDIDPRKVKHSDTGWMANAHLFKEDQEFNDRILVATSNLSVPGGLVPVSIDLAYKTDSKVRLTAFAKWARTLKWEMPAELIEIVRRNDVAPATPEPQRVQADDELSSKERNYLLKLVHVLADMAKLSDIPPHTAGNVVEAHAKNTLEITIGEKSVAEKIKEARDMFGKDVPRKIPR